MVTMTRLPFRGDEVLIAILCGSRVTIRFELLKLTGFEEMNEFLVCFFRIVNDGVSRLLRRVFCFDSSIFGRMFG